ncbi:hypothetical protein ACFLUG_02595 [Chloroflexota bacterium]
MFPKFVLMLGEPIKGLFFVLLFPSVGIIIIVGVIASKLFSIWHQAVSRIIAHQPNQ